MTHNSIETFKAPENASFIRSIIQISMAPDLPVQQRSDNSIDTGGRKRNVEERYRIPEFQHAYKINSVHPLTTQGTDRAHSFLASHGVDKQLGPEMWSAFVSAKTPVLVGYIYIDVEPLDFMWICRFMGVIFAMDTKMDEGEYSYSPEKSLSTLLGMTLALLWNNPEDEHLLKHVKPLYDECTETDESRAIVKAFYQDLVHAKNKTRDLVDIEMPPLASAFRELWIEYEQVVPAEFILRQANTIQEYLKGCVWEARNRKASHEIRSLQDYILIRRWASCGLPFFICSDMLVARSFKLVQIPNSLFYGPEMQSVLLAITDIIAWHNDTFSFYKEVILAGDIHNLVNVLYYERKCASYTQAAEMVIQLVQERIADMECAYEQLKAVASSEYHPAIDRYMSTCRDWISGSHQWHLFSDRYNM